MTLSLTTAISMKLARISISTLMMVVLVVAVNAAAGDIYFGMAGNDGLDLLNFGARPMASVLAIGAVPAVRAASGRTTPRPFLVGFEIFGLSAIVVFIAASKFLAVPIHQALDELLPLAVSRITPLYPWSIMAILVLPQLAVAVLGGKRSQRGRVAI